MTYYERNREEILAYSKKRYEKNREEMLAYSKKRYKKHREEMLAYSKKRYKKHHARLSKYRSKFVCEICGRKRSLEFHHIDSRREAKISSMLNCKWESIKEEVDKCMILCNRCHNNLHWLGNSGERIRLVERRLKAVIQGIKNRRDRLFENHRLCKALEKLNP